VENQPTYYADVGLRILLNEYDRTDKVLLQI